MRYSERMMSLFHTLQKTRKVLPMNLFNYCKIILALKFGMMQYLFSGVIVFGQRLIKG